LLKSERRQIEAAAKRDGAKLSEWLRRVLLAAAQTGKIDFAKSEGVGIEPYGGTGRDLEV
jgi:hypothetical protein